MLAPNRLLENGVSRLLGDGFVRELETTQPIGGNPIYQNSAYAWSDRTGITVPDITGPIALNTLSPTATNGARNLVVTADGSQSSMVLGVAVILWDERGNPISANSGLITLSGWAMNAAGYFIAANGYGADRPGFIVADVSNAAGYAVLVQSFSNTNVPLLGSVATVAGSSTVVGTSTGFVGGFVGRWATFSDDPTLTPYKVVSVADSFHLALDSPISFSDPSQKMVLVNPVNLHWRLA